MVVYVHHTWLHNNLCDCTCSVRVRVHDSTVQTKESGKVRRSFTARQHGLPIFAQTRRSSLMPIIVTAAVKRHQLAT